jgi:carbon-monoxide dehydrogenase large subunit
MRIIYLQGWSQCLHENDFFDPPNLTWSNGAQACEIEINPQTGVTTLLSYIAIDDVGTVINPMVVEGQVHGAIAQGIGQALFESAIYEPETGQIMTGSFMDYAMPRADILPDFISRSR